MTMSTVESGVKEPEFEGLLEGEIDPSERAHFIERTGVLIRWMLILAGTIIQIVEPVIPAFCFYVALPVAILYNFSVSYLLKKRKERIVEISYFTAIMDNIASMVLIFLARTTDIYLWYFVLLVSHAARFGFIGSIVSPVLFSLLYVGGLLLRGFSLSFNTILIRVSFFVITGIVSGYLAREEHRRFIRILKQQRDIFISHQKRREMREMLQRYLSYNLVEELLKNPSRIQLGGVRQKVSVLFSDISGFTRMLSVMEPERVIKILNQYLTEMTQIIFQFNGMVDKFVGDAVIGIFGAVHPSPDDTLHAVQAALSMQERLRQLQQQWMESGQEIIEARVAVNTGEVVLGNIGSPQRMDFTAIGDTVNTASRLQAVAEVGKVIISRVTCEELANKIEVRDLGEVTLRGKGKPIEVYEVLSFREEFER
jgi:class 3 adenylate cyclase